MKPHRIVIRTGEIKKIERDEDPISARSLGVVLDLVSAVCSAVCVLNPSGIGLWRHGPCSLQTAQNPDQNR